MNLQWYGFSSYFKEMYLKILADHPVYSHYTYGTIALVALFLFICTFEYPQAASQTWFSQSAGSVKSFLGDSVRPSASVSYIFPSSSSSRPLGKIYLTRERERERKKKKASRQLAVCARSFLSGRRRVAQEIRWNFAQNGKRAAGVLGYANSEIRDFMNDKASGWPPHRRKEGPTTRWKKTGTTGKRSEASERASEPVTAWPYN